MAPEQEDRGVDPENEDIVLSGPGEIDEEEHVLDATGRPAKPEDDLAGD